MLMDAKFAIQTPSTLSEDLVAGTTVAFLSEPIDFKSAGYTDGGGELMLAIRSKVSTAGVANYYRVEILGCDTVGGTYVVQSGKDFARAACATGKFVGNMLIGKDLPQFIKVQITGGSAPGAMTGSTTFNAAIVTE